MFYNIMFSIKIKIFYWKNKGPEDDELQFYCLNVATYKTQYLHVVVAVSSVSETKSEQRVAHLP